MRKETEEKQTNVQKGVEWYRKEIIEMVNKIDNKKFLNQIRIILKRHIEKRGD